MTDVKVNSRYKGNHVEQIVQTIVRYLGQFC